VDDFERELKVSFLDEASQLMADAEQCFLRLEKDPTDISILENIFRIAHNLKGSSKAVGFDALSAFTHEFESFMLKCKSGKLAITPATISILLKCNDHVSKFIELLKADGNSSLDSHQLIDEIKSFVALVPAQVATPVPASTPPQDHTEVSQSAPADVDALYEPLQKITADSLPPPLPSTPSEPPSTPVAQAPSGATAADESIRVSLGRLEKLLNLVGELVIHQTVFKEQFFADGPKVSLGKTIHQMGKVTKEVQELSMSLRMVPLRQTFQKMQRIVRDTSGLLNKQVHLVMEGDDTEVDKIVLEALSDPLVHLIRNAVDHGIETPTQRLAQGKNESGEITLRAYHQGGKLVLEIRDDGNGIDPARLQQKAIEKGLIRPDTVLSEKEAIHLIFHPGFSTKAEVTEVSGRGVGMDVVKTNIERLQGEVLVETLLGKGSVFKVILPLTLSIIDAMVVRSGEERYVIPLSQIHESFKPEIKEVQYTTGLSEILLLRGENLPLFRLSQLLRQKRKATAEAEQIALVMRNHDRAFAVFVDDIIGQHQVVVKKLGTEIRGIQGYAGSAILGNGRPALILELNELILKSNAHAIRKVA
jgi:two-component system chemotaxis sensor kinase CheA